MAYLRSLASQDIGSILTEREREVLGWAASWVENRLDVLWKAEVARRARNTSAKPPIHVRHGDWVARAGGGHMQVGGQCEGDDAAVANDNGVRRRRS